MAIRTVNPADAYNQPGFASAMEDFGKLEEILQGISSPEGNWNPILRKDLGNLLKGDPKFYESLTPDTVINDASEVYKTHSDNIAKYSANKFNFLLGKLDEKALLLLVRSLPLVKTGKEDLDKIVDAVSEQRKIGEAAQEGSIEAYVQEKLKNAEEWRQRAYFGYSALNQEYNRRTFQAYARVAEVELANAIKNKDGKVDKKKLYDLIAESYGKITADKGVDSKEAKAYQLSVAKIAHQKEK